MKIKNICFGLFIAGILCVFNASAQQLPNYDFSAAGSDYNGSTQPANWNGSNVTQVGLKFTFVKWLQGQGRNGDGAVSVANQEVGAMGITATAPGYLSLGQPFSYVKGLSKSDATAGTEGGLAFTYRPDTMSVWLQRSANGLEDLNLVVYSWKGTSKSNIYMSNGGSCMTVDRDYVDEESDIRQTDKNVCGTSQEATQISDGHYRSKETWNGWKEIKVPITYYNDDIPEKINVILSSGNYPNFRANSGMYAGNSIIVDEVTLIYSSKIHELRLNNLPMASFNPNTYEYTYELAQGKSIPTITAKRSGRTLSGSEISINYGTIGQATTITVKAEDGSSTSTYKINFVYSRSTNCKLNSLSVNGVPVSGFASNVSSYKVALPFGTVDFPEITYEKGDDKQTVEIKECAIPGTAEVVVTAENPDYSMTYYIELSTDELSDTTLEDIQVNGKSIPGYSPTKLTYTVEVPTGTTEDPVITYTSAYPDGMQTVVVENNGLYGQSTITVSAPGSSTSRVYKLSFKITESSYCYLDNIYLDGEPLSGFAPETFSYNIPLGPDATALPTITYDKGDDYQIVTVEDGGLDGTTTIKVQAQNGINSAVYRLNFSVEKSTNSKLSAIYIGGELLSNFSPDLLTYAVSLPIGTTELPEITWEQGDKYQTVTPTYGGVNGDTKILVTAQSGARTQYVISFSVKKADVSTLEGISVGGVPVEGFAPDITKYDVILPIGTVTVPDITYIVHDEYQTVTVDKGSVNGTSRITVRAQSGSVTFYYLNMSVELSTNTRLSDIKVGGESLPDFEPDKQDYVVELPAGTVELPSIEVVKADDYQNVTLSRDGVNGVTTIEVKAQNDDSFEYRISFRVKKSENAYLSAIYVDGQLLEGFQPEQFNYNYTLSDGVLSCPQVSVDKADAGQSVQIITPSLEGQAKITVTPEQGESNIYTIRFGFARSSVATLNGISIGGELLPDFAADVTSYTVQLPAGTKSLPVIEVQKAEDSQVVEIITNGIDGTTEITVVAADGTENIYKLLFSVEKSSVSDLKAVMIGDYELVIEPGVYSYEYILPDETSTVQNVIPVKVDELCNLTMSLPVSEGIITIQTYSQDGRNSNVYTINVHHAVNSSTSLKSLSVGGEQISLQPDVYEYTIERPYGFESQEVACEKSYEEQKLFVTNNRNEIFVEVVAESGDKAVYKVVINELPATASLLAGLQIYDELNQTFVDIAGFAPDVFEYQYVLVQGSKIVPVVNPIPADDMQKMQIVYGKPNSKTVVKVVAGDGSAEAEYSIDFVTEKSNDSSLAMIYINGEEIGNFGAAFDAAIFDYQVLLPYGTNDVPAIAYERGQKAQKVDVVYNTLSETSVITVTAEDGSQSNYNLNFSVDYSGKTNVLSAITIDGEIVDNFSSDVYEYEVELPYNAANAPVIAYTKTFEEQTVLMANQGLNSVKLIVKSNIGLEDTAYTINFTKAENPASLSAIKINGNVIPGFETGRYKYIYTVPEGEGTPSVSFIGLSGNEIAATTSNVNYAECVNTVDDASLTYSVYFHYASDVIPNGDFESWSGTTYNGAQKPTGWTAPADVAEKYTYKFLFITGTYNTGNEVVNDNGQLMLQTYYKVNMGSGEGNNYSISGAIPGMITTGDMSVNLASAGNSKSSVSGGITFRNTPDQVKLDYNPISNEGVDNWRMLVNYYDANGTQKENLYEGSYETKNQWQTADMKLSYSDMERLVGINKFNFVLNASHSETGLGSATAANPMRSVLYVDNLRATYNSAVQSFTINGITPELNDGIYNVSLSDLSYYGLPTVEVVGEVPDQSYSIDYGTEQVSGNYMVRDMMLTSYAEDGSTSQYNLRVTRPIYNYLAAIKVNGENLQDFVADKLEYLISLPAGASLPDVEAIVGSSYQQVEYAVVGNTYSIILSNENNTKTVYKLVFDIAKSEDNTLKAIYLNGVALDGFASDENSYAVDLPAGTENYPLVTVAKNAASQRVKVVETEQGVNISVFAENDMETANVYVIAMNILPATNTTKQLKSLSIYDLHAGENQIVFEAGTYEYEFARAYGKKYYTLYAPLYVEDDLIVDVTDGEVVYTLSNTNSTVVEGDVRYVLTFTDAQVDDTHLKTILADGVALADFNAETFDYEVDVVNGYYPSLEAVKAYSEQSLGTSYDEESKTYIINVTVPSGESSVYKVHYNIILSQDAKLGSLNVAGSEIELKDGVFAYEYQLPVGTVQVPDVVAQAAQSGAYIEINLPQTVDGVIEIVVTSEDGNFTNTYTVQLSVLKSSDATLKMIYADHKEMDGFVPDRSEYDFVVGSGASKPVISYQKAESAQTVEIITDDETETVIKVTAEDGVSVMEYTISYIYEYSDEAGLSAITLDGQLLSDFNPDIFEYNVELPTGTTVLPELAVIPVSDKQQTNIVSNGVNGDCIITTVSEDGKHTVVYTIHFSVKPSELDTLAMIYIGGEQLSTNAVNFTADKDFAPTEFYYHIDLPVGTTTLPRVTADAGDIYQTFDVIPFEAEKKVQIQVTAQAGNSKVYEIEFSVLKSKVATLSMISVSGEPLSTSSANFSVDKDFAPDVFEYDLVLPVGSSIDDYVFTFTKGDQYQSAVATIKDGVYQVDVTAEDVAYTNTYIVNISVKKSDNAYLADLLVNGVTVDGFDPEKFFYQIDLPVGTSPMPKVTYVHGDIYQIVVYETSKDSLEHTITVTSQSGIVNEYEIRFNVLKSNNANLADLRVSHNDASLQLSPAFDPAVYEYKLVLPYKYRNDLPKFDAIKQTEQSLSDEHQPQSADDDYSVKVVAEDGVSSNVYTVDLLLQPSNITSLDMIYVDGSELNGFMPDVSLYEVELPYGTVNCPEVSWILTEPENETATAEYNQIATGWNVTITVEAASQDANEYVIHFTLGKDNENRLASLSVFGDVLEGFMPEETQYSIVYPPYTDSSVLPKVEDISYELMHPETSEAVVMQTDENTIVVQVTAANGDVRNYVIETSIEISSNNELEALYVYGEIIEGFDPLIEDYYYSLQYGTSFVDEQIVTFDAAESGQVVTRYKDGMDVRVSVTAQDGSVRLYTVHFVAATFDPSKQASAEDVCITSTSDGYWKFTTKCNNVYICLADLSGRPILNVQLPLVDPNIEDICSPAAEGYLYIPQSSEVLIYFFHSNGHRITSGKIRTHN